MGDLGVGRLSCLSSRVTVWKPQDRTGVCVASHPCPEGTSLSVLLTESDTLFYLSVPVSAVSCFDYFVFFPFLYSVSLSSLPTCFALSFFPLCLFLFPVSFPLHPPDIHWHLLLTSFPLSWSLSSCLVTAFPTSPTETIATSSLEMRPFILLLSFAFPPLQAMHVDAPITGTQAGCLCPRPIHSQVDSEQKLLGAATQRVSLCLPQVLPAVLKDSRISTLMLQSPHARLRQGWKERGAK